REAPDGGGRGRRGRGARGGAAAPAADSHDVVCVRARVRAAVDRVRIRRGGTPDPRHGGDHGHADGDARRDLLHPAPVRAGGAALGTAATGTGQPAGAGLRGERLMTRRVSTSLLVMLPVALAAGCATVGPDYVRPDLAVPDGFRGEPVPAAALAVAP